MGWNGPSSSARTSRSGTATLSPEQSGRDANRNAVRGGVALRLHGEQDEERHHQTEETHSLRQSKTQDGIGEELLL